MTGIAVARIGCTPIVAERGIEGDGREGERGRITYVTRVAERKIDYLSVVNNLTRGENAGSESAKDARVRKRRGRGCRWKKAGRIAGTGLALHSGV